MSILRSIALTMALVFAATPAAFAESTMAEKDIVETAESVGEFTTLVAALEAAGLVDTLKGDGPFTVFAPTDDAFAKLPDGTVENLLMPENRDQLVAILTYHVIPGRVMASDVQGKQLQVETVEGSQLSVDGTDGVTVDNATVTMPDVAASNGVIHVIDSVVIPGSSS